MAESLRPDIAHEMRGTVGVAVSMAIKAADSARGTLGAAIVGLIELLLHKRRNQEPHPFEILRIKDVVKDLEEIVDRDELAFRDITQVGSCGEENRGGKLGQEMIGEIKIEIKAGKIPLLLFFDFLDVKFREEHSAFRMIRMGERQETGGPRIFLTDLVGRHFSERLPCHSGGELRPYALLDRFTAEHRHAGRRFVRQIVPFREQVLMLLFDRGFLPLHPFHHGFEIFLGNHRHVAGGNGSRRCSSRLSYRWFARCGTTFLRCWINAECRLSKNKSEGETCNRRPKKRRPCFHAGKDLDGSRKADRADCLWSISDHAIQKRFGCDSQSAFLFLATETLVFYENAIRLNAEQHEQERQLS